MALVTGGGRGIGREAALLLAAAGVRVMITARSATELAAVGLEYVVADLGTAEGCALARRQHEFQLHLTQSAMKFSIDELTLTT